MEQNMARMGQVVFSGPEQNELRCLGLGSCIGLCVMDPAAKLACLAHIVLPESFSSSPSDPVKYANTAIPYVIKQMADRGAIKTRMRAAIVGGAQLFNFENANTTMDVGKRNIEAVKKHLSTLSIRLTAEDVGGKVGRSVVLDASSGDVLVRQSGVPEKCLVNLKQ